MMEEIKITEGEKSYNAIITNEMEEEEGNRIIMMHLLWSTTVFMISILA